MGREKHLAIEVEETLPALAMQAGALRECEIHSETLLRSFDDEAEEAACDLAIQHFHPTMDASEAREQMMDFLENTPEDCMACDNLMRE